MAIKHSDNPNDEPRELVITELDAVVGGTKSDDATKAAAKDAAKDAAFGESSAAHRDRSRDAVVGLLDKLGQIKARY